MYLPSNVIRQDIAYLTSTLFPISTVLFGIYSVSLILGNELIDLDEEIKLSTSSIVFVAFSLILSSLLLLFIFTKLNNYKIRIIYATILSFSGLQLILELYLRLEQMNREITYVIIATMVVIFLITVIFFYVYAKGLAIIPVRNMGILITSIVIGRQISIMLEFEMIVFIIILFAIYDLYSVFYGPLSKVIGKPTRIKYVLPSDEQAKIYSKQVCEKGTPVYIAKKYSVLGIGDTLFFAIIFNQALVSWGEMAMIFSFVAILIGSVITLIILKRLSPLPALPIPVILVLLVYTYYYLTN